MQSSMGPTAIPPSQERPPNTPSPTWSPSFSLITPLDTLVHFPPLRIRTGVAGAGGAMPGTNVKFPLRVATNSQRSHRIEPSGQWLVSVVARGMSSFPESRRAKGVPAATSPLGRGTPERTGKPGAGRLSGEAREIRRPLRPRKRNLVSLYAPCRLTAAKSSRGAIAGAAREKVMRSTGALRSDSDGFSSAGPRSLPGRTTDPSVVTWMSPK